MRRAFTIIELLIAVLIIAILATMVVLVVPGLRDRAKALDTSHRLQAALNGVQQASSGTGDAVHLACREGLGRDLRWGPMREVFSVIMDDYKIDLNQAANRDKVPYRTVLFNDSRLRLDTQGTMTTTFQLSGRDTRTGEGTTAAMGVMGAILTNRGGWQVADQTTNNAVTLGGLGVAGNLSFVWPLHYWAHTENDSRRSYFGDLDQGGADTSIKRPGFIKFSDPKPASDGKPIYQAAFMNYKAFPTPLRESFDRTLEVIPSGPTAWNRDDWLKAWPALGPVPPATTLPAVEFDPASRTYQLRAWPEATWTKVPSPAVRQAPIWEWPWGEPILSRATGKKTADVLRHDLSEFDPLATVALLQLAGIVPAGSEGVQRFRTDRNPNHVFNDRWGNPLVLVAAGFIVPRYDAIDKETIHDLLGGRDELHRLAMAAYGHARAVYLAAGAVGPRRILASDAGADGDITAAAGWNAELPLPGWESADDDAVLRLLWRQIRDVCRAADWDETGWAKRPWTGVRDRRLGKQRCLLSNPVVLR